MIRSARTVTERTAIPDEGASHLSLNFLPSPVEVARLR